jgi:hypothetical protein
VKLLTDQECQEGVNRIEDLTKLIASESGIRLQSILFDDGQQLTCKKTHNLRISARGKAVTAIITHSDVTCADLARPKIRAAIDRLKSMLE